MPPEVENTNGVKKNNVQLLEVFGHKPSVLRSHVGDRQMEVEGGGKTWHYDEKPGHQRKVI